MPVFNKCIKRKKKKQQNDDPSNQETKDQDDSKLSSEKTHNTDAEKLMYPILLEGEMPTYFHIGGLAKGCLKTGYKIGAWHFDCTTKLNDKLHLYTFGSANPTLPDVSGGVGVSEKFGIFRMSQAYQTQGFLGTFGIRTGVKRGFFSAMLRGTYSPNYEDSKRLELHTGFEHSPVKLDVIIPILNEPKLMGYVVLEPAKNYMLGFRAVYDITDKGFDKHALGIGYNNGNTEVGLKLENFKDLRGSLFQRLGERWAVAFKANLYSEEGKQFAVGGQYQLSENGLLKAKLRNDGLFGMVYKFTMSEYVSIMYHFGLDAKAPIAGDHKIGLSWSLMC